MSRYLKTKWIVLAVVIIALGFLITTLVKSKASTSSAQTGKVTRGELVQRVTIAGAAEPIHSTIVTAPYDGYIKKIYVKLGDAVKAGDPLVSIAQSLQSTEAVFPVRAPFAGTVTQVLRTEGQYVKSGDTKDYVLKIDDISTMFINSSVPEIDFPKIKTGQEAVVKVSAILSRSYKGTVGDIAQSATMREQWGQRSQVDYSMKIKITDADSLLKPGMTAVVDIITDKKSNVLMLRHEFIYKEDEKFYVMLKNGTRRDIQVGVQNESVFEIVKGLSDGDEVTQVDFTKLNGDGAQ